MDFRALLAPWLAKGLIWATRQDQGKAKGDADLASPLGLAALGFAANAGASAVQSAAAHGILGQANDALAKVLGVATTEQNIAALGPAALPATLDLDTPIQGALSAFLEQSIVKS